MQVWVHAFSRCGEVAKLAAQVESWGFAGLLVADSQNLNADIWVELALASVATTNLLLGPGVTNVVTRHPAVTASAAASLQEESGGRVVLGLGRGDSALTQLGLGPVPPAEFEERLAMIQAYLRGESVVVAGLETRIKWIAPSDRRKVPVAVAATGPKVMEIAARQAERVDVTVGAEPDRIRWALETVRSTGQNPSIGAFVNVALNPDRQVARDLVRGSTAIFARFAIDAPADGLSDVTRDGIADMGSRYERERHGESHALQAQALEDAFIDRFAIAGPSPYVVERTLEIASLGIDRLVVVPASLDADPRLLAESNQLLAQDVLPALEQ